MKKYFICLLMLLSFSLFAETKITKSNVKDCIKKFFLKGTFVEFEFENDNGDISDYLLNKDGFYGFEISENGLSVVWLGACDFFIFDEDSLILNDENNIILKYKKE